MQETWKIIEGFEGYEVSSFGNVRSVDRSITQRNQSGIYQRTMKGKQLKPQLNNKGYEKVWLGRTQKLVHRLVAEAFLDNPLKLPQVNHEDGNKRNNRAINLAWTDNSGNQQHARSTGLITKVVGEQVGISKLNEDAVRWIRKNPNMPTADVANKYDVHPQTILDVRNRRTWKHIQP